MSNQTNRREFLHSGIGLGTIALQTLLLEDASLRASDVVALAARAKRVIYLHMVGAPSQLDLFDYKPELNARDGQACPAEVTKDRDFAFIGKTSTLAGSPWKFQQHGESGQWLSELLPHLSAVADELTVIRSVHSDEINHAPAQMFLHSGFGRAGRPSLGAWLSYGLGSEAKDLPAYVVLLSGPAGGAGTSLWSSGFLPSRYQGVQFRSAGDAVLFLSNPERTTNSQRRIELDAINQLNQAYFEQSGDSEALTRIAQYEMAFQMQASVPELMNISDETEGTLRLYGIDDPKKPSFANNCLLARRLVERGVRMVELYDADWDHHGGLQKRLPEKCQQTDQAIAGLIRDLRQRGMLDETLVIWGSEFGRTPLKQNADNAADAQAGRDHHKDAFTMWLAGGGVQRGLSYGQSDPLGMDVVENPVHVHDLNATILHLLGIDHQQLTFRFQGRDYRLTDVHGAVQHSILT